MTEEQMRQLRQEAELACRMGDAWLYLPPRKLLEIFQELDGCKEVCQSLADRVAKQSELLSRRAEKPNPTGPAAPPGG